MVDKIAIFALTVLAGWAIAANFAVFRYRRAADGSLEENKRIGNGETIARVSSGIGCFICFGTLFLSELATMYVRLLNINPQAIFVGEVLAVLTALVIGVLHALISYVLCALLAQKANYYLLCTEQSSSKTLTAEPEQPSAPPAAKHAAQTSRRHSNTAPDQPDPTPVYGTTEPTQIEPASQFVCTGPHFTLKACDLVAAMKDAGWKLTRESQPLVASVSETTATNV